MKHIKEFEDLEDLSKDIFSIPNGEFIITVNFSTQDFIEEDIKDRFKRRKNRRAMRSFIKEFPNLIIENWLKPKFPNGEFKSYAIDSYTDQDRYFIWCKIDGCEIDDFSSDGKPVEIPYISEHFKLRDFGSQKRFSMIGVIVNNKPIPRNNTTHTLDVYYQYSEGKIRIETEEVAWGSGFPIEDYDWKQIQKILGGRTK